MTYPIKYFSIIIIVLFTSSCKGQKKSDEKIVSKKVESIKYDGGDVTTNGFLDKSGNMWFTTTKEGVFRYDGTHFTNFTKKDGLSSNAVSSVIEDREGVLLFGTANGLSKYDGTTFSHIPLDMPKKIHPFWKNSSRSNDNPEYSIATSISVFSLLQDESGNIWIGTDGAGVYRYDGQILTNYLSKEGRKQSDSLHHNVIQSMVEDNAGNIWFTSQTHGGISRYDGEDFTHFTKKDGLPDDMIFSSFKDEDGTLWFGTLDNGFFSYKEGSFNFFNNIDATHFMVSCFYQDKSGKLWIGSFRERTISLFDGENITSIPFDKDKNLVEIRFITEDKDDNIWFGGRYGILWRYDGKELKDFTQEKRN